MYGQLFKVQQKHQVALEVLTYHCSVTEKETQQCLKAASACTLPNDFYRYVGKESVIATHSRRDFATIVLLDEGVRFSTRRNFTLNTHQLFCVHTKRADI